MYQRLIMAILFVFFAFGSSAAQKSPVIYDPIPTNAPARSEMRPVKNLRLKGVLISSMSHTALVNGRAVQEGGRVGGAEILVIEQHGIRVRVDAREFTINVGNTPVVEQSSIDIARVSRKSARDHGAPRIDAHSPHEVKSGETLSGIALRYRKDGVTVDQMMIALYQSNPQAFSGNINILHEGAVLTIPGENALRRQTRETATAEFVRQTKAWRKEFERHARSTLEHTNIMASADGVINQVH